MAALSPFEIRVPGKWVLAGEHSVVRGGTAIALPLKDYSFRLTYRPADSALEIEPAAAAPVVRDLLTSLEDRWQAEDRSFPRIGGRLSIESTIPMGAGMGSSAALCVSIAKWLQEPLQLSNDELQEFARQLEHRFHGTSSGMDVAVILAGEPVSFSTARGARALGIRRLPRFTFHDTRVRSRTSDCISKVQLIREQTPSLSLSLDELMAAAVREGTEGLILFDAGDTGRGLKLVTESMKKARECFYSWGLVPTEARHLEEDLMAQGALAAKLTGSGGGGMMVALWNNG